MIPRNQNKVLILDYFKNNRNKRDTILAHFKHFKKIYPRYKITYMTFFTWCKILMKEKAINDQRVGHYNMVWYEDSSN